MQTGSRSLRCSTAGEIHHTGNPGFNPWLQRECKGGASIFRLYYLSRKDKTEPVASADGARDIGPS
jgi:hypothetical protein